MGFAVYRSEGQNQQNQFVVNPFLQLLKVIPAGTFGTPGTGTTLRLKVTEDLEFDEYKTLPTVNQWCQLSLYAVSINGQLTKIGAVKAVVTNTLSA